MMGRLGEDLKIILTAAVAVAMLIGLGIWQLDRLGQKRAQLAAQEARLGEPPAPVEDLLDLTAQELEFLPALASGTWVGDLEFHQLTTRRGAAGWQIVRPLQLADSDVIFVNQGFVPHKQKMPDSRAAAETGAPAAVSGVLRQLVSKAPDRYLPENDLEKNVWYWLSFEQMAASLPSPQAARPLVLIANPQSSVEGGPQGRVIKPVDTSRHLSYALTWFGLALAMIGVAYFSIRHRRRMTRLAEEAARRGG